jgi:hypothetical protein
MRHPLSAKVDVCVGKSGYPGFNRCVALVATVAGQRRTLTGFPCCAPGIRALGHFCRGDIELLR